MLEERLFAQHRGKSILLDSNLLLVLLAGAMDARLFGTFKRISTYSLDDYELLERLVRSFSLLVTTPYILAEVGSLANSLSEQWREEWSRNMAAFLTCHNCRPSLDESWTQAKALAAQQAFVPFGLTDASVAELSNRALILTDDFRLSGFLRHKGAPVLNFRDLRQMQGTLHG